MEVLIRRGHRASRLQLYSRGPIRATRAGAQLGSILVGAGLRRQTPVRGDATGRIAGGRAKTTEGTEGGKERLRSSVARANQGDTAGPTRSSSWKGPSADGLTNTRMGPARAQAFRVFVPYSSLLALARQASFCPERCVPSVVNRNVRKGRCYRHMAAGEGITPEGPPLPPALPRLPKPSPRWPAAACQESAARRPP